MANTTKLLTSDFNDVTDSNGLPVKVTGSYPSGATPWTVLATSLANTEATATKAAEANKIHYITGYLVVLRAATSANDASVSVKNGATIVVQDYIGNGSPQGERVGATFSFPIQCSVNTAANLVVGAAGAGAITELTLMGYTL